VAFINPKCVKIYNDSINIHAWIPPSAEFMIQNPSGEDITDREDIGIKATRRCPLLLTSHFQTTGKLFVGFGISVIKTLIRFSLTKIVPINIQPPQVSLQLNFILLMNSDAKVR
jgi:hypothetical protein